MKKVYKKPEACCWNRDTGEFVATSEAYVAKAKEMMIHFLENNSENMEESFAYGRKISGES